MDPERAKRRQSAKIIISETIMVLAVVITVTMLAFIVTHQYFQSTFIWRTQRKTHQRRL